MNEITPQELKRMQDAKEAFMLVDVREPYEAERFTIGGKLIPMGEIVEHLDVPHITFPTWTDLASGAG